MSEFIIILIAGIIIGAYIAKDKGLISGQLLQKDKNKQIILKYLTDNTQITNDQAQELLNVSDATATRYLSELELENKITQVGDTGRGVYYTINK